MQTVDIFPNFEFHPDSQQLLVRSAERSIAASLRQRVLIGRGERPFEKVGSDVQNILFENFSEHTTDNLTDTIKEALAGEVRAFIDDVEVIAQELSNRYVINIYYRTNFSQGQQKISLVLYRVR